MLIRPVDWTAVMTDFRCQGLSIRAVAELTDISKSTLADLGNGYNHPGHWNGEKLIALWTERTGKSRIDLPAVSSYWPGIRTGT